MRIIIEIDSSQLDAIKRRKVEFFKLIKESVTSEEKQKELLLRFATKLLHSGPPHETVVMNVDGETVYRR